jgi:hypothetical protein
VMSNQESDQELEQRIRERAFQIWIEEGQPQGRDKEHWSIAAAEFGVDTPPLQPDQQPIGEITQAQEQTRKTETAPIEGGINPDDVTR